MTLSELRIDLKQKRAEAAGLRIGLVTQKDKDSARYKRVRREIAQLCFAIGQTEKALPATPGKKASEPKAEMKSDDKEMKSTSQTPKKSVKRSSSKKSS